MDGLLINIYEYLYILVFVERLKSRWYLKSCLRNIFCFLEFSCVKLMWLGKWVLIEF